MKDGDDLSPGGEGFDDDNGFTKETTRSMTALSSAKRCIPS